MCNVFPDRIRSRTVRTLTILESRQTLRSGTQMGIHSIESLISRLHPGFCSVSSSGRLSLPLLDRLTEILPPLIQELCLPIGRGCLFYGTHLSWFNKCVFASASPQIHLQNRNASSFVRQTERQTAKKVEWKDIQKDIHKQTFSSGGHTDRRSRSPQDGCGCRERAWRRWDRRRRTWLRRYNPP